MLVVWIEDMTTVVFILLFFINNEIVGAETDLTQQECIDKSVNYNSHTVDNRISACMPILKDVK